mgnify:CR=1 FL=1
MQTRILQLICLLLLTACAVAASSSGCPTLYPYSSVQQTQAAAELEALPPNSVLALMIGHYGVVRNEIRVCQNPKK